MLGNEVKSFEKEFSDFNFGANGGFCAGVASGLDALIIGIRALGIGKGDEVIVQGNTYIASVMGITINGATPIFVEPDVNYQIDVDKIEAAITPHTRAVMVVHLYGEVADMDRITEICKRHGFFLIEDCAQAHGAIWRGKKVGTFGDVGCFSFYPTKNIGAFGDAGALISNDENIIAKAKVIRNYGSQKHYYNEMVGMNSRLDEIQASLLRVRLKYVDEITRERKSIAKKYIDRIHNEKIILPMEQSGSSAVWHQFVVRCAERDKLIKYLDDNGIDTIIHYPIPPHLQTAYKYLGNQIGDYPITEQYANEVLSIPMYNGMTDDEQKYVIDVINNFE